MNSKNIWKKTCLAYMAFATCLCHATFAQTSAAIRQKSLESPSYEVATVKPAKEGEGFPLSLRDYILSAFGLNLNASRQLVAPPWINSAKYEIHGKPSDAMRDSMDKMTPEERGSETRLMMQALLADRFKMKYHFETREMKVYNLVVAKGAIKLKDDFDRTKSRATVRVGQIKGTAVPMKSFVGLLSNVPELDGLPVLDKTGLTGLYDFSLNWTPFNPTTNGNEPIPSNSDTPSLFKALEEQVGLKLEVAKASGKVLVVDHIEPPSAN